MGGGPSTTSGGGASTSATAIPRSLLQEARPIGAGRRFHPGVSGSPLGACRRRLGRRSEIHLELFAANRVVLVPAGIGTLPPRRMLAGRIVRARCYGEVVTLDATGVVLVAAAARLSLQAVFGSWGEPLSRHRLLSFKATEGHELRAFVDGRPWQRPPGEIPLLRHSEIVLEMGPYVPPHRSFTFPRLP